MKSSRTRLYPRLHTFWKSTFPVDGSIVSFTLTTSSQAVLVAGNASYSFTNETPWKPLFFCLVFSPLKKVRKCSCAATETFSLGSVVNFLKRKKTFPWLARLYFLFRDCTHSFVSLVSSEGLCLQILPSFDLYSLQSGQTFVHKLSWLSGQSCFVLVLKLAPQDFSPTEADL